MSREIYIPRAGKYRFDFGYKKPLVVLDVRGQQPLPHPSEGFVSVLIEHWDYEKGQAYVLTGDSELALIEILEAGAYLGEQMSALEREALGTRVGPHDDVTVVRWKLV